MRGRAGGGSAGRSFWRSKILFNPFLIGFPTCLLSLLIAYILREISLRNLDVQQAGTMVLTLRPIRLRVAIVIGSLLALLLLIRFTLPHLVEASWVAAYFPLSFSVLVVAQMAAMRALSRAQFPPTFVRPYRVSQFFDILGYGSLLAAMMLATLGYGHR
jgi:hypothetical protein